jgi:hypothetical protein
MLLFLPYIYDRINKVLKIHLSDQNQHKIYCLTKIKKFVQALFLPYNTYMIGLIW